LAEYKAFIDGLVDLAHQDSPAANAIRHGVLYQSPGPEDGKYNQFVAELSSAQRELLAAIVQNERQATIAHVLRFVDWKEYRLSRGAISLAVNPFAENFYDYTCRMEGDTWPDERDKQAEENT
jgi:hypothetical protein